MAVALAEKQIREGTASSQVITHFLKLGTEKAKLERDLLEKQRELITAKTEAIRAQEKNAELYAQAIKAMQIYSGNGDPDDY